MSVLNPDAMNYVGPEPEIGIAPEFPIWVYNPTFAPQLVLNAQQLLALLNSNNGWTISYVPPSNLILSGRPEWFLVASLSFSQFALAALSNSLPIFNLPPAGIIHGMKIRPVKAFAGSGSISAVTLSLGDLANPSAYADPFNVFQPPGSKVYQLYDNFAGEDLLNPTAVYATLASTGANLNALTAGLVNVSAFLSVAP